MVVHGQTTGSSVGCVELLRQTSSIEPPPRPITAFSYYFLTANILYFSDEGLVSTVTPTMRVPDDDDQVVEDGPYTAKGRADLENGQVGPKSGRSPHLSGGIGQPRSADKASPATENALAATSTSLLATSTDASTTSSSSSAATSSESALAHSISRKWSRPGAVICQNALIFLFSRSTPRHATVFPLE